MRSLIATLGCLLLASWAANAQASGAGPVELEWYIPWETDYDESIPTPEEVLGWQVGEWHVSHDQLIRYFERLAAASDRVSLVEKARTHEDRPMLVVRITSEDNQGRLEEIRRARLEAMQPGSGQDLREHPVVVWMGYSIHGDEASGSNASLPVAYHLAAARDERTRALLDNTVVLIEPSMNPDGLTRFSTWVNSHRGRTLTGDPQNREHNQVWPRARTNHYWFDLNRDWLPVQHPESRARIDGFHRWKPNIVGDWHEMGRDSTYFFQPGVPDRDNPRTPDRNYELTAKIAEFHARIMDAYGEPYFTKEGFDDFYYGKGSTFPDINSGIGILYEQGSARGHLRETIHGERRLADSIRNQTLTSFSTLEAAFDLRRELLEFQQGFFREAMEEARRDRRAGFIFGDANDRERGLALVEILLRQDIRVHELERPIEAGGQRFEPGSAWVIPLEQPQYRFIRAIMERQLDFPAAWFYDISTWTLPLAFNLPVAELSGRQLSRSGPGPRVASADIPAGRLKGDTEDPPYYAFDWGAYYAPRALHRLLEEGVVARVASAPFTARQNGQARRFDRGSIVIPVGLQDAAVKDRLGDLLAEVASDNGIDVTGISTGLAADGVDLGSRTLRHLEPVRPMIVVGDGVNMLEAGEAWHLLDHRFGVPVSLLEMDQLGRADLSRYTHVIMVDGNWNRLSDQAEAALKSWTRAGGVLVAQKGALRWLASSELLDLEFRDAEPVEEGRRAYADYQADRAAEVIGGSIFESRLDLTHPLAWGYDRESLPVFRNSTLFLEPVDNPYANVALYTDSPLLSGYISERNLAALPGTASVLAERVGSGTVVAFADNPNFRAFWYGTNRLFLNAIFFGQTLQHTRAP
jgi:hypothetical protein